MFRNIIKEAKLNQNVSEEGFFLFNDQILSWISTTISKELFSLLDIVKSGTVV